MVKETIKRCCDCDKSISFAEFQRNNPAISKEAASDLWENPIINIYCLECFLNRPEMPYRKRKRFYSYYQFKFRK